MCELCAKYEGLKTYLYVKFKKIYYVFIHLALLGLCCCMQTFFPNCSEQELLSSCGAQASHCSVCSCGRAQALQHADSVVVALRLSCPMASS